MTIYPANLPQQLDFSTLLEELENYCLGKKAKEIASKLQPISSIHFIKKYLNETAEFLLSMQHSNSIPLYKYPELEKELHLLSIENAVLTAPQFHSFRYLLQMSNELILFLKDKDEVFPYLKNKIKIEKDEFIIKTIDDIIDKDAIVKDDASPALQSIRKRISENRRNSDRAYRIHIQRLKKLGHLADFEESIVNGRRVLSVLAEHKREIKGILLSQSASGKIAFIEPQNLIEINNEKLQLEDDEKKEIYKILKELTLILEPYQSYINTVYELLIEFDFISAKAKLAKSMNATLPIVTENSQKTQLVNAFHPVLFLQNSKTKTITHPINCTFDEAQRIMVISGPNAGGKSITLKTIGLLQLMLQCGLLIPVAAKSEMGIKKKLFGDIGDNQSIEDGLSTYSSRLLKMKYFLKHTDEHTLFLIDEFGTGSDPDMGGAMAEIILDKLNTRNAQGVVTTHFTNLKLLANSKVGVYNACMLFNTKSLKPLYQLHIGEPGSSFTFEVAEKIGLPQEIIEEAKSKLSNEKVSMDKLLNLLQQEKNVIAKLKRDLQKQMSKTTAEKREFISLSEKLESSIEQTKSNKEEKQKLIEYGKKLHQLTQEWNSSKNKKQIIAKFVKLAGFEQAKMKEKQEYERSEKYREERISKIKDKLTIGSKVRMLKSKEIGIVKSLKNERAKVLFGKIEMNVGIEKLEIA